MTVAEDAITTEEAQVADSAVDQKASVLEKKVVLLQEAKAVLEARHHVKVVLLQELVLHVVKADFHPIVRQEEAMHLKAKAFQKELQDVQKALAISQDQNVQEKAKFF